MEPFKFDKILYKQQQAEKVSFINLYFINYGNELALYFDGVNFNSTRFTSDLVAGFSELPYSLQYIDSISVIEVKHEFDVYFFKISNGDILQIYSMMDSTILNFRLDIFDEAAEQVSTPLGISSYAAAAKRMAEADTLEILDNNY